jgi:hypothetical protein
MDLGSTGNSCYTVDEIECTWPKDPKKVNNYKIHYYNMKFFIPKKKINKKLYYPFLSERFDVDGCYMEWDDSKAMYV